MMTTDSATALPAFVSGELSASEEDPDDSGYGSVMFFVFIAAVLVVTLAVCILAVVGSWWMLGVAVAVHVGMTAAVILVLMGAFGPEADRYPDLEPVAPGPKTTVAAPTIKPMARLTSLLPHH